MTLINPAAALSQRAWKRQFGSTTLTRGRSYWHSGRVIQVDACHEDADGVLHVRGSVRGSQRRPYTVTVSVSGEPGDFLYDASCTCPVGFDCKHAVALLLAAAETNPDDTSTPATRPGRAQVDPRWNQWLNMIKTPPSAAGPELSSVPDDRRLAFLFDTEFATLPIIRARAVWLFPTKQGRLGKPTPVGVRAFSSFGFGLESGDGYGPDWCGLDTRQLELIAHLRMGAAIHAQGFEWHAITGNRGEHLLQRMLTEEICYWQKPTQGQIQVAALRPMQWRWQLAEDGAQTLRPDLASGSLLLCVERLWCFDPVTRDLGPVEGDPALTRRLLTTPPLLPEQTAAVRARWQQLAPLQTLPAPVQYTDIRHVRVPPTPILRLHAVTLPPQSKRHPAQILACARLAFDYAGQRIDGSADSDQVRRVVDGVLLIIERTAQAERQAYHAISQLPMLPARHRHELGWKLQQSINSADFACSRPSKDEVTSLLQHAQTLQAQGFRIEFDPEFPAQFAAAPSHWHLDADDNADNAWFDLELGIEIDGHRVALLPILRRALLDQQLNLVPSENESADAVWYAPLDATRLVPLPLAQVRALLTPLLQWLDGSDGDRLRLPRAAIGVVDELAAASQTELHMRTAKGLRRLAALLSDGGREHRVKPPAGLAITLRDYQLDGLNWLGSLAQAGLGGVLADDMGLGKTVQVLAHILAEKRSRRLPHPALIVAPTSVVPNWRDQAARFTPKLRVQVLHGLDRHAQFETLADCDLAITTYALLARDREALLAQPFSLAVFDEAQAIKNPNAKGAQVARALQATRRLAVTGTPLENHLGELWAQFVCVLPGLLGDARRFTRNFRTPIEKHADSVRQAQLNRRIAPFLLRRNKEQVARELPAKTEIVQHIELAGGQRTLYETLRLAMHEKVQKAIAKRGLAQSSIVILDALLKLRQACCDPRLVKLDAAGRVRESAKLEALLPMLEELLAEGRRILLFSQFTGMLDLIQAELQRRKIDFVRLDGSTRDRETP
ncbi:MAG TPA: SNF2-related protein, partial [Thermomonas sp.]|nr:SNF2-related protein [Thermomonas sp.]